jgi:transposase-like protein
MKNREAVQEELRAAITQAAKRGDARGVPAAVRRQVLEFVAAERSTRGTTARATAAALGVHETTLSRWAREAREVTSTARAGRGGVSFRAVRIAEPTAALAAAPPACRAPVVRVAHPTSGLVIEGLDIEMLTSLLRSLS